MAEYTISFPQDKPHQRVRCEKCDNLLKRVAILKEKGAEVIFGVDGTKIHEVFKNQKFPRIHWNCPHDGNDNHPPAEQGKVKQTLPLLIARFFSSCAKIQNWKDRVHVTLAQPFEKERYYQGWVYSIAKAASLAGFEPPSLEGKGFLVLSSQQLGQLPRLLTDAPTASFFVNFNTLGYRILRSI